MTAAPFADRARVDARDKVTGETTYAADVGLPRLLHAMTAPARIAKGRVAAIDTTAALAVPGVVRVLTADDFPPPPPQPAPGGPPGPPPPPTLRAQIGWRGEPIALVVAETIEAAIEGAEAVTATYVEEPFVPVITDPAAKRQPFHDTKAGDARRAMARAVTSVEVEYETPPQHHNPIELLSTTAVWAGGRLTIHESTQGAQTVRALVAKALSLDPDIIEVRCPYLGGGFGQRGPVQRQVALVAHAAMLTGRPVKMVMPRGQIFHNATFRPLSRHRIKIGADSDRRMVAVEYDADHQQSRTGQFPPDYHDTPVQLYGIADYLGTTANVRIDTQGPGFMRAPHPHPACFAFEGAVDELAYKLGEDPLDFRLKHDTTTDPVTGRPLSSRFLRECLVEGARRFGWSRRDPRPGVTTLTDGTLVGSGVACGAYPAAVTPNIAKLRVSADGTTRLALSGHEMGQGIRTVIAAVLHRELDVDPTRLEIVIGETSAAPQHVTAGSWGTASVAPVVEKAARELMVQLAALFGDRRINGDVHGQLAAIGRDALEVEVSQLGPGQPPGVLEALHRGGFAKAGPVYPEFTSFSYVAHFAEVHVAPVTRRIRVPRVVSIVDCGRVISPRTAASQVRGGIVWAIGSALHEETDVDPRFGGWLNNDLADYVVPVNADIGAIEVGFIDRPDPLLNSIGAKGLGEVAMAGAAGAIANAVFHATGRRMRRMPIRIEHLL